MEYLIAALLVSGLGWLAWVKPKTYRRAFPFLLVVIIVVCAEFLFWISTVSATWMRVAPFVPPSKFYDAQAVAQVLSIPQFLTLATYAGWAFVSVILLWCVAERRFSILRTKKE